MPEMVTDITHPVLDEKGEPTGENVEFKAVNYDMMIPVLVKAIQEQQAQIDSLKQQIEVMKAEQNASPAPEKVNNTNTGTQPIETQD